MAYISIGLKEGTTGYTSFEVDGDIEFSSDPVYGKNFNVFGEIVNAGVGGQISYGSISDLNNSTLKYNFNVDIENVKLFGKTSQRAGSTTELSGATISEDKRTVLINTNLNSSLSSVYLLVYVNGKWETEVKYDLIQNLTNCTSNISGSTINKEEDKEIILTCNDGFIFDKVPTITIGDNTLDFNLNNDLTVATITVDITDDVVINAVARANIRVYITGSFTNATCNYSNGELLKVDKNIIISANSGYTFKGSYSYKKGARVLEFNNYETYLEIPVNNLDYDYYLFDDYTATREVEQLGTFVNLYRVTNSEIKQLAVARFVDSEGTTVDYGKFITQLYVLPFTIPNDIIGEKDNIILGNYDSNVKSTLIRDSKLYIDGGIITVPNKYNNVYDYLNTTCTLRLPFFNPIILDVDNVIDKTISIQYIVDLYSGNCTVNISSSFTGEIIHSETTNIVTQIPFIQKQNNSIINQLSNANENLIDNAFIEIVRNIPYYANDIFGKKTIVFDTVGSVTGYCEISDIQLITTATNEEKEEIETLLKNGVFIKESEV